MEKYIQNSSDSDNSGSDVDLNDHDQIWKHCRIRMTGLAPIKNLGLLEHPVLLMVVRHLYTFKLYLVELHIENKINQAVI